MVKRASSRDGFPMGDQWGNPYPTIAKNLKEAARRFCCECNGQVKWVEECTSPRCSLFPWRPGTSLVGRQQRKKRVVSKEHLAKMARGRGA